MGEYLREFGRRRADHAGPPGRLPRAGLSGVALLLLGLGAVLLVVAVVRFSVVGAVGGLLVTGAGVAWWQSDRLRGRTRVPLDPSADGDPDEDDDEPARGVPRETKLAALSLVTFLVGLFGWLAAMIKGW